jgi:hypothetical protein
VKLSVKGLLVAAALVKAIFFLFVSLLNLIFPPYGGQYLAVMTFLYPGYDPLTGPISVIVGTLYALLSGAIAGALLAWLYNRFATNG